MQKKTIVFYLPTNIRTWNCTLVLWSDKQLPDSKHSLGLAPQHFNHYMTADIYHILLTTDTYSIRRILSLQTATFSLKLQTKEMSSQHCFTGFSTCFVFLTIYIVPAFQDLTCSLLPTHFK